MIFLNLGLKKKYSDSQVDKNVINFLFPVTLPLAKSGEKKKEEEEEEEEEAERWKHDPIMKGGGSVVRASNPPSSVARDGEREREKEGERERSWPADFEPARDHSLS